MSEIWLLKICLY